MTYHRSAFPLNFDVTLWQSYLTLPPKQAISSTKNNNRHMVLQPPWLSPSKPHIIVSWKYTAVLWLSLELPPQLHCGCSFKEMITHIHGSNLLNGNQGCTINTGLGIVSHIQITIAAYLLYFANKIMDVDYIWDTESQSHTCPCLYLIYVSHLTMFDPHSSKPFLSHLNEKWFWRTILFLYTWTYQPFSIQDIIKSIAPTVGVLSQRTLQPLNLW